MNLDDLLRPLALGAWIILVVVTARPVWRLLRTPKLASFADAMAAFFGAIAILIIVHNLRWYFASDSLLFLSGLHAYSALLAGRITLAVWRRRNG